MKKLLILIMVFFTITASAQTVKLSSKVINTNVALSVPVNKVFDLDAKKIKTKEEVLKNCKPTPYSAIFKKEQHQVYITEKGKLFIPVESKSGGFTRKYIKQD